jgi:hypothetical protein
VRARERRIAEYLDVAHSIRMNTRIILATLVIAISLSACTRRPQAPASTAAGTPVASVAGTIITDKELMGRVEAIEKTFPRVYSTHIQKKKLLSEMMNIELLYQRAIALGLDKKYEFKSRLADLYVQQLSEKAKSEITDKQIHDFFETNRARYEQISAKHILLKVKPGANPKEKKAVKDKLESLRKELLADPTKFADYAQKYSEDASKSSGGELGYFNSAMMVPPFSKAAFALQKVGDISPIIETQFGYHLIQLSGDHRGFDIYKDAIRDQIVRSTQRERLEQELENLKKDKNLQIFEDNLAKLSPLPKEVTTDPKELIPDQPDTNKNP